MTIEEKKQRLFNLENQGKELEKEGRKTNWRDYNIELQRRQKDYVKDTKERRERLESEAIREQAEEFTDIVMHLNGTRRSYYMGH